MQVAPRPLCPFVDLEARLSTPVCRRALAEAYAASAARIRRRPMRLNTRYRYPRGRATDTLPLSPALA
ncbi:MAG: hypothetical protein AAF721_28585 [Myxococcota bacterium]